MRSRVPHSNSLDSCSPLSSGRAWLSRSSSGASTPSLVAASSKVMSAGSTRSCDALASARARSTSGGSGSSSLLPFLGTVAAPATTCGGGCNPAHPRLRPYVSIGGRGRAGGAGSATPPHHIPSYTPLPHPFLHPLTELRVLGSVQEEHVRHRRAARRRRRLHALLAVAGVHHVRRGDPHRPGPGLGVGLGFGLGLGMGFGLGIGFGFGLRVRVRVRFGSCSCSGSGLGSGSGSRSGWGWGLGLGLGLGWGWGLGLGLGLGLGSAQG